MHWAGNIKLEMRHWPNRILTDVHAPAKERVNGPVVDVPEWYTAFNIKPGDKMYVPDSLRVKIW